MTTYDPKRSAELVASAKQRVSQSQHRWPFPPTRSELNDAERAIAELADQLEAATAEAERQKFWRDEALRERDALAARIDHQTTEYQRALEMLRADLATSGEERDKLETEVERLQRRDTERLGAVLEADQLHKKCEALQRMVGTERDAHRLQARPREAKAENERLRAVTDIVSRDRATVLRIIDAAPPVHVGDMIRRLCQRLLSLDCPVQSNECAIRSMCTNKCGAMNGTAPTAGREGE